MKRANCFVVAFVFLSINGILFGQSNLIVQTGGKLTVNGNLNIIPVSGLVCYFPFNGNANDESGYGHHGTVYGATLSPDRFGNTEKAYFFDGVSSYIQAGGLPMLNTVFSYSVWIRVVGAGTDNHNFGCYGQIDVGATWDFAYNVNSSGFSIYDRTNHDYFTSIVIGTTWKHVVVVYDHTIRKLYVDGSMLSSEQVNTPIAPVQINDLRIGEHVYAHQQKFMGQIDDIRVYDRALSESEIHALYHEGGWAK